MNTFFRSRVFLQGLFLFVFGATLLLPLALPVDAAIVPCGRNAGTAAEMAPCTLCHLIVGIYNIVEWLRNVIVAFSIAAIVAMGILYIVSTGNDSLMEFAKGGIKAALIGFAVIISAWLMVNIIFSLPIFNETVVKTDWSTFTCDTKSQVRGTTVAGGGGTTQQPPGTGGGTTLTLTQIQEKYGVQIATACSGSPIGSICNNLVAALIEAESSGRPGAVSPAGSLGLMQLLPSNGGKACAEDDQVCITGQIQLGVKMLNDNFKNPALANEDLKLTLASYNGGAAAIRQSACCTTGYAYQCLFDCDSTTPHSHQCDVNPAPPCKANNGFLETRNYVTKICSTIGGCE